MKLNRPELLAPASSLEGMLVAYKSGADAVYAGGSKFSARAFAKNFTDEEIVEAIKISHIFGKKFYLAVNTMLKEKEILSELYDYLLLFYYNGLDACIVQDMGVFSFIKSYFPDLELHISTQASITGLYGAKFFEEAGAKRIVTAREISLIEIKKISDNTSLEIEAFIHGALCYCYSGQCLFSSMLGTRSGNRGRCAQPCRLPYDILDENHKPLTKKKIYPLSLKDICTVDNIVELIKAGVTSFKVEGRMKSLEYVAGVLSIYRKYIDKAIHDPDNFHVDKKDYEELLDIYNRGGFSGGYYKGNLSNMLSIKGSRKKDISRAATERLEILKERLNLEIIDKQLKQPIEVEITAKIGEPFSIRVISGSKEGIAYGKEVEEANNKSLTKDDILRAATAFGNTYFESKNNKLEVDDNIFLPIGEIKRVRRAAVLEFEKCFTYFRKNAVSLNKLTSSNADKTPKVYVSIDTVEQYLELKCINKIDSLFLNVSSLTNDEIDFIIDDGIDVSIYLELPQIYEVSMDILLGNERIDGFLVKNYETWYHVKNNYPNKKIILGYNLYCANSYAINFARSRGAVEIIYPIEITKIEIEQILSKADILYVYGYIPLMVTKQSISGIAGVKKSSLILKDRKNVSFDVRTQNLTRNDVIFNSVPLDLIDLYKTLKHKPTIFIDFTKETRSEVKAIMNYVLLNEERPFNNFTRGHFKKGID